MLKYSTQVCHFSCFITVLKNTVQTDRKWHQEGLHVSGWRRMRW